MGSKYSHPRWSLNFLLFPSSRSLSILSIWYGNEGRLPSDRLSQQRWRSASVSSWHASDSTATDLESTMYPSPDPLFLSSLPDLPSSSFWHRYAFFLTHHIYFHSSFFFLSAKWKWVSFDPWVVAVHSESFPVWRNRAWKKVRGSCSTRRIFHHLEKGMSKLPISLSRSLLIT